MKLAVVANPVGALQQSELLREAIAEVSVEVLWFDTTEDDAGGGQAREALASGADVVLACGGDGTVRACAEALIGTSAALAVVPAGTGNLLAGNLALPDDPAQALEVIQGGARVRIDVGRVEGEVFTVMAGAGLDAVIMDETSRESKDRLGVLAYVAEAAGHLFDDPFQAVVSVDGETRARGSWVTVLVGNLGRLQGGVDLFPDSSPGDGRLDLVGLTGESAFEKLSAAVAAATGIGDDRLFRASGATFRLDFDGRRVPYELDGEARGEVAGLSFEVIPKALTICVPAKEET